VTILVTGGAGYIGSHMVRLLRSRQMPVAILDDFCTGHRDLVPAGVPLLEADIGERARVTEFLRQHGVEAIVHFAARALVGESVVEPRLYWRHNVAGTVGLLDAALDAGVSRFVFSSTCAIYGIPSQVPIPEGHPPAPINPYGACKLAVERMLADYAKAYGLRYAALRYFNAAGAEPEHGLGERHAVETHLIPLVLQAASGQRAHVTLLGSDYETPDGSCIRDYIHVSDLAEAHLAALAWLERGGESGAFNLGTGRGHSVLEVIAAARALTNREIPVVLGPRREGDPPALVASPARAQELLGWTPRKSSLVQILRDAWAFQGRAASL
jgi:UDP-glucose-4-epimerase GalE